MNMKKSIKILGLTIIATCFITNISRAAIEIKPGRTVQTDLTVSNAYQYCYDLRNAGSTLGVNSLDPHLTLNKDWGAVAYLGISGYGNVRSESNYTNTTGNKTGVMNFGNITTFTASYKYENSPSGYENLINNKNTKYVEILDSENNTKGYAIGETRRMFGSGYFNLPSSDCPILVRKYVTQYDKMSGTSKFTFRPVIWN